MKKILQTPLFVLLVITSLKSYSQSFTATYEFTNANTTSGRTDPTPVPTAAGLTFGSFTAVAPAGNPNVLGNNPNATGRFSFVGWPTGATNGSNTFTGSINTGQYYEVTITPQTYYTVNLDSITFTIQRSGTGIRQYSVRSSADGFAANLPAVIEPATPNLQVVAGNIFQVSDASTVAENGSKIVLAGLPAFTNFSTPVTFRFYGWNAEGAGGTFSIDNVKIWGATALSPTAPNITTSTTSIQFPATAFNSTSQPKTYTIHGNNLTGPVTITTTAPFSVSADNITYSTSIDVPEAEISSAKTIYVKFRPVAAGTFISTITHNSPSAAIRTINVSGDGIDPANLEFNFNTCSTGGTPGSGFTSYSVTGAQAWSCTNFGQSSTKGVDMNGFSGSTQENEDWLISPPLAISALNLPIFRFYSRAQFSGPSLQLLVSINYDGSSNPNTATWTELEGNFPQANNIWTFSDGIDLSAYKSAPTLYIAFRYTSSVELGSSRWTIDDVDITNRTQLLSVSPLLLNFGEAPVGTNTAGLPFNVKAIGYGDITLAAPSHYQLSFDSTTYSTTLMIPAATAAAGTKLFARLSPTAKILKTEGPIRFTATGLDSNRIMLSGTSFPRAETFDAGGYNLSFFGSTPTNNPTLEKITTQVANIATVFNRLKLDVTGISEVSNDLGIDSLVKKVPNSRAILSPRYSGSYFAPQDPNFPPQKIGFLFDTTTMKLVEARVMFEGLYDSARTTHPALLPNYPTGTPSSFWASGRLPYMGTFDANINGIIKRVRVIVIHAKSATTAEDYNRRLYDAKVLKDTLDAFYKNDNVVIVGDYNDRLISSIYTGSTNSPYKPFIADNTSYTGLTVPLDSAGRTSFIGGSGLIDHIIITNPLSLFYVSNSTDIEDPRSYISGYNATTASDHLPVYARFSFSSALPITLINFDAEPRGNDVLVTWSTATEINNKHFLIERSADGRNFTAIATINSQGNYTRTNNYQFVDAAPLKGTSYYRIRQVDNDDKFTFSKI
ncbi:MAG: hypothetical protein JWQ96_2219, partial [Segetibacter sp.]|nr:hypothetical protein [Segetibacter sp.]